jgi:hypothetical protein
MLNKNIKNENNDYKGGDLLVVGLILIGVGLVLVTIGLIPL